MLTRLVEHFERHVDEPLYCSTRSTAQRLAKGTVGIRLPITRFICKVKMSQDKDPQSRLRSVLRGPSPGAPAPTPATRSRPTWNARSAQP